MPDSGKSLPELDEDTCSVDIACFEQGECPDKDETVAPDPVPEIVLQATHAVQTSIHILAASLYAAGRRV